jgi:hypothetical protein
MVSATNTVQAEGNSRVRPIPLGNDNLAFRHDLAIMNQLDEKEHIVYSVQVGKYNRFGMRQNRNLLLTTAKVYNVKGKEF